MARRKTGRLVCEEYVSQDSGSVQLSRARLELFEAVKRVYPTFLEELSDPVFPLYRELAEAGCIFWGINGPPHVSPYELVTQGSLSSSAGHSPDTPETLKKRESLKAALFQWAVKFNADRVWLKDDALRTLQGWHTASEWRESLKWNPFYGRSGSASTGDAFRFECQGWETQLLNWPIYRRWVRLRFEEELLKYEKQTRQLAKSCGLVRAQRKYSPVNFDWFVLYQFAGRSSTNIARGKYGDDPDSTVLKGVKTAARLVGWGPLRRPGHARQAEQPEN